jgi:hypothetical protein
MWYVKSIVENKEIHKILQTIYIFLNSLIFLLISF